MSIMLRTTLTTLAVALAASLYVPLSAAASAGNRSPVQTTGRFFLKNVGSPAATTKVVGAVLVCHEGTCKWFKVKVMDLD